MPKWTKDQEEAIYRSGENIIVSAGAGSGKTAVLTERVIEKLKQGIHIHQLLILTFTKAAAGEMKDRIRKSIKENPELIGELTNIDQAYITTFDSFSLSILKKYHYVLGLDKDIGITESSLLQIEKAKILDQVLEEMYEEENSKFLHMIEDFCTKDDQNIKLALLRMIKKLELKYKVEDYLESYIDEYYQDENIKKYIVEFQGKIEEKKQKIMELSQELSYLVDGNYMTKVEDYLKPIFSVQDDTVIKNALSLKFPSLPRGSEEEVKKSKEHLTDALEELDSLLSYGSLEDKKKMVYDTKENVSVIVEILKRYFQKVQDFKKKNAFYEFSDIAFMSISILENNEEIREELKKSFVEILVDEYQDTNDLQETFISYIARNNVYMVGDVNQSIYRFRNANPHIFRKKYNAYQEGMGGAKIDLVKNFRSRREVLEDINAIFRQVMDNPIGGADYKQTHQMVFGLTAYEEDGQKKVNRKSEFWTYDSLRKSGYSDAEVEAFLVARDIQKKVEEKYPVYDKDLKKMRDARYADFVILMDRSSQFELYKKIFEYLKVPLDVYKDEYLEKGEDLSLIKNIIDFIIHIRLHNFDSAFEYDFVSIARSFLYRLPDSDILDMVHHKKIEDSIIYQDLESLSYEVDNNDIYHFLQEVLLHIHFYEKSIEDSDIAKREIRMEKILALAHSLDSSGYSVYEFKDYLETLLKDGYSIRYKMNMDKGDSAKIMTIHLSKGLEYPVCYFTGLNKPFNISDIKDKFLYSEDYGIIAPYFEEGISETFLKYLLKNSYMEEEVSEKIRLFYVALTRAREKMIFLLPYQEWNSKQEGLIPIMERTKYKSFADILNSLGGDIQNQFQKLEIKEEDFTKNYLYPLDIQKVEFHSERKLMVEEVEEVVSEKEEKQFSKKSLTLPTKEEKEAMRFGSEVHEILEYLDFRKPNLDAISNQFIRSKIEKFLNQPLLKSRNNATIYKEHEFIYEENHVEYHGIIDCMLEYSDKIDLIDYKLKHVADDAYQKQLEGYKTYLEKITNKKVNLYLYSILDSKFEEISV